MTRQGCLDQLADLIVSITQLGDYILDKPKASERPLVLLVACLLYQLCIVGINRQSYNSTN